MNYLVENNNEVELKATREGFGEAMVVLGRKNEAVVALSGDLRESLRMVEFGKLFPERFVEVGVAEQNMAGVAAGMALCGKIPFVCSFAVFSPGRNWDQIRVSIAYTNANVKIVGGHTGISVGSDGATHQALEDIALMRVLPNMIVVVPADAVQAGKATLAIANHVGPCYLRLTRPKTAVFMSAASSFEIGKAQVLREGNDATIFACGPLVYHALLAAKELEGDVSVEVINVHTIKPLDEKTVIDSARKTGKVITLEDHQVNGGLGGAVAEVLGEKCPTKMIRMGMKDVFGESGETNELMVKYGMDKNAIVGKIREIVR
jgi:transketolase